MNLKQALKLLIVLFLSTGLAFSVACGDDDEEEQEVNQNQDEDVGVEDANGGEPDANGEDPDVNGEDPDADEPDADAGEPDPPIIPDPVPTCDDDDAPPRCEENLDEFDDWGPASILTELIIDPDCCVDFGGQGGAGNPDNALAQIASIEDLDDVNDGINGSIQDGDIIIILEHDGLEAIEDGQEYDLNFLLGEEDTEDGIILDPASFDDGAHPHAVLPNAKTAANGQFDLTTEPGTVFLSLSIGALIGDPSVEEELELRISRATIEGTLVEATSTVEDGVVIEDGELAGLLRVDDLVDALNTFTGNCDCLDNSDILGFDEDDEMECTLEEPEVTAGECEDDGEDLCGTLAEFCGLLEFAGAIADVDTTGDLTPDAFSLGLTFEADATTILEVGDGALGDD